MSFTENSRVKIPAILHLCRLGYTYLPLGKATWDVETNIFTDIFLESVGRLNSELSKEEIKRALEEVKLKLDNEDLGNACSITDDVLTKMNMHSTSFYVYRFNNSSAGKPHGIIVFEKMDPSPISTTVIDPAFARHHDQIAELLKSMKSLG